MTNKSTLQLGLTANFDGEQYLIIGRVRYTMNAYGENYYWWWNEWLLLSNKGQYKWLSEDEEGEYTLEEAFTPITPIAPAQIREGASINLDGNTVRINEVNQAIITMFEGDLTWQPKEGEKINYADASSDQNVYSIMWDEEEITFYKGRKLSRQDLVQAFNLPADSFKEPRYNSSTTTATTCCLGAAVLDMLITVFIIVILLGSCLASENGCGGCGGGSSTSRGGSYYSAPSGGK